VRLPDELSEVAGTHARGERLGGRHHPILTPPLLPPGIGCDRERGEPQRCHLEASLDRRPLKAVERIVEEDKYCVDILKQTMAIEKALERVDALVLEHHLETCVADAFRQGRSEKTVKELAEIFSTARK